MVVHREKQEIRQKLLAQLLSLTKDELKRRSENVANTLSALPLYKEANVINFVNNLKDHQKLLIIHGDLDDNAHYQGVVQLVAALQRANKHFQFMVYPGANHSYAGTGNPYTWLHLFTSITNFITTNL